MDVDTLESIDNNCVVNNWGVEVVESLLPLF